MASNNGSIGAVDPSSKIWRVAVVGAGTLGIRIAGELALQGCTVHVYDENPIALQKVHSTVSDHLQELKENGLLEKDQQLRGAVIAESVLSRAVTEAVIVFEAIHEDLTAKNGLFRAIASVCPDDVIFCTSTLSLELRDVFADVPHLERTLGLRFLFPVYLIDVVELTSHTVTSDSTTARVQEFLKSMGKSTFSRVPGEHPRKLTEEEVFQIQQSATGWSHIHH